MVVLTIDFLQQNLIFEQGVRRREGSPWHIFDMREQRVYSLDNTLL